MSKYEEAKRALEAVQVAGEAGGWGREDAVLALLVSGVQAYRDLVGPAEARKALQYELDNLGGKVDTVFLRSR